MNALQVLIQSDLTKRFWVHCKKGLEGTARTGTRLVDKKEIALCQPFSTTGSYNVVGRIPVGLNPDWDLIDMQTADFIENGHLPSQSETLETRGALEPEALMVA